MEYPGSIRWLGVRSLGSHSTRSVARIGNSGAEGSPYDDPLRYPGRLPEYSYLVSGKGDSRIDLPPANDCRRLGQASVIWRRDGLERGGDLPERQTLGAVLVRLGSASIDERYPVLAYGSNAGPAQLARKFRDRGLDVTVPVIRARVTGLAVVCSAHVAPYGAIPATIKCDPRPSAASTVFVCFVDEKQLDALEDSERNYDLVFLDGERYRLDLLTDQVSPGNGSFGERLRGYCAFISKHGWLDVGDGPRGLPGVGNGSYPCWDQSTVLSWALREAARGGVECPGTDPARWLENRGTDDRVEVLSGWLKQQRGHGDDVEGPLRGIVPEK
jgi:hypothetical protein